MCFLAPPCTLEISVLYVERLRNQPRRPQQAVGHQERAQGSFHPGGRRRRAMPCWTGSQSVNASVSSTQVVVKHIAVHLGCWVGRPGHRAAALCMKQANAPLVTAPPSWHRGQTSSFRRDLRGRVPPHSDRPDYRGMHAVLRHWCLFEAIEHRCTSALTSSLLLGHWSLLV